MAALASRADGNPPYGAADVIRSSHQLPPGYYSSPDSGTENQEDNVPLSPSTTVQHFAEDSSVSVAFHDQRTMTTFGKLLRQGDVIPAFDIRRPNGLLFLIGNAGAYCGCCQGR